MNNIFSDNPKENKPNRSLYDMDPDIADAKFYYDDFVEKMNKSDMCNTSERYISELYYVRKLKELYAKHRYPGLSKEMEIREKQILNTLKDEFGIRYN